MKIFIIHWKFGETPALSRNCDFKPDTRMILIHPRRKVEKVVPVNPQLNSIQYICL